MKLLEYLGKQRLFLDGAMGTMLQAAAAALLEAAVDDSVEALAEEYKREGLHLLQRYSPGYGDCPLTCQQNLLRLLDSARRIGLTCTNGNMLTPTKSITAFIGLSPATGGNNPDGGCKANRCTVCNLTDCPYRRSDV